MARKDPIAVAKQGGWLLAGGAYGLWQVVSDPAPGWIAWCAMSLPIGALLVVLGLRSHVLHSRGPLTGSELPEFDPLVEGQSQPRLPQGHGIALVAGYLSIFTLLAALGLLPMGAIMLYQRAPSAVVVLVCGLAAAGSSWWLIRKAARSMGSTRGAA